jgi:hypothetical protein
VKVVRQPEKFVDAVRTKMLMTLRARKVCFQRSTCLDAAFSRGDAKDKVMEKEVKTGKF